MTSSSRLAQSLLAAAAITLTALSSASVARADDEGTEPSTRPGHRLPLGYPPDGEVGLPTPAGTTGLKVTPGLEIFAGYAARVSRTAAGSEWFHAFDLPRAHGSLTGEWGPVRARVVIEAVRSATEGALLGVAGDSLLMRLREASAGVRLARWGFGFWVDAGVVPTLTVPELDGSFNLRVVAATPLEATGLSSPADLGGTVRVLFPKGYGSFAVGAYNGEGYTGRERNRGKNIELAAEVHPFASTGAKPLAVFASYVKGSAGTGRAQADRLTAAILWQGRIIRGGGAFTYAWGVADDGAKRSILGDVFVRVEPIDRLIFGVRGSYWQRDLAASKDRIIDVTGSAGYRIFDPLEAHLAVTRILPGEVAADALPGIDRWDIRVLGRVVF